MPHIKLDHTENVKPSLIKLVFNELKIIVMEYACVKEKNCKCKAILIPIYAVGSNDTSGHFYHIEISLLKGRSENIKEKIGQKSLQVLQKYFTDINGDHKKQFSIEIRDINPKNYFTSNAL